MKTMTRPPIGERIISVLSMTVIMLIIATSAFGLDAPPAIPDLPSDGGSTGGGSYDPPVTIKSFVADLNNVRQGEFVTLSWEISNATQATIDNGIGQVSATKGSLEVALNSTTTFTLTAVNTWDTKKKSVTISVSTNKKYFLPCYKGDSTHYVSVALRNSSESKTAEVSVILYDEYGDVIQTVSKNLPPQGQDGFVLPQNPLYDGWIYVESTESLTGLCWVGSLENGRPAYMADISLISDPALKLIIPHVAQDDTWDTTIFVCNPNNGTNSVKLKYYDAQGVLNYTKSVSLPPNGSKAYSVEDLVDGTVRSNGSVKIEASKNVAAFALYYDTAKSGGTCYAGIGAVRP
ncbi:MAG: hypothetical protein JW884_08150 [Deltaproteobacteria bacterium]|nr:hypothetical protein [Deltaproteobacteria bacterium]